MKKLKLPALLLATAMVINLMPVNSFAIDESESEKLGYARKSKYVLCSSGSNAMQINASEAVVNGNLYTGADLAAYCGKTEVNGTVYIAGELRSGGSWSCYNLEEHSDKLEIIDFSESLINSLGEDYITHEYWYTYSGTTVTNNAPIYAKSGLQFCATDVTLDGTICSEEYLMISASDTFNSVEDGEMNLYCANGNIGIYAENIDIDGLIYAPNGTVQLCGTNVHIDGGIIAKEIQISAQYFTVNENLDLPVSEQIFNPDEHTLMASASYVEESDLFEVSLISTWPHGSYSVYVSENGTDYTLLGSTDKETYVFPYDATELYIKAVQTYEGNEILESNVVRIMYNEEEGYKEEYIDSDEDGLFDLHEHLLGTDIMNPDTDEDGISDYDEVFIFGTDPLYADSDEDGVIDSYEDDDNDGISNAEELVIGTNPSSSDTDDDGISDSDETNRYGTDPLIADMDDDGLSDSDEIALGLDPSINDSDGDGILDDAEKFEQTYTYCTEEDVIEEIYIEMNATGNIQSTLTVESVMGIDVLSSSIEGLIGEPYSITTSSDFDEATVTFKINTENLEGELDEYCIIWYDGEDYYECQSSWYSSYGTSSSDLISANLPSKKGVVAVTERDACDRLVNGVELTEYYSSEIADTIFIVSGDYGGTPTTEGAQVEFIKDYLNSSERDVGTKTAYGSVEIITRFYDSANPVVNFGATKNEVESALSSIIEKETYKLDAALSYALGRFSSMGYTRNNKKAVVFFVLDSRDSVSTRYIEQAVENEITVCVVTYKTDYSESFDKIAAATGGIVVSIDDAFAMTKIHANLTETGLNTRDYDGDGLYDVFENRGMKTAHGTFYTSSVNADTDNDRIWDGREISVSFSGTRVKFKVHSNPAETDSDGDGLPDGSAYVVDGRVIAPKDENPNKKDGPEGMWLNHIASVYSGAPSRLGDWYKDELYTSTNSGYEGFAALLSGVEHYANEMTNEYAASEVKALTEAIEQFEKFEDIMAIKERLDEVIKVFGDYFSDEAKMNEIRASLGSRFLNFRMDSEDMALHSQYHTWQAIGGYSNMYDDIFRFFTDENMDKIKLPFSMDMSMGEFFDEYGVKTNLPDELLDAVDLTSSSTEFILWGWRGNYLNLGAGAELGIYMRPHFFDVDPEGLDQYFTVNELALPMKLYLYNYNEIWNTSEEILSWEPVEEQWWITGFNPHTVGEADAKKQVMIASVDFSKFTDAKGDNLVFETFVSATENDYDNMKYIIFDKTEHVVWIMWSAYA